MKRITILIAVTMFTFCKSQILTNDTGANVQLAKLNVQLANLNTQLATLNTTSTSNKGENYASKILEEDKLNLAENAENFLWSVPGYLKNGPEINTILELESKILKKIQEVNTFSKYISDEKYKKIYENRSINVFNLTSGFVDEALNILTDDVYRMEEGHRKKFLDTILERVGKLDKQIGNLLYDVKMVLIDEGVEFEVD